MTDGGVSRSEQPQAAPELVDLLGLPAQAVQALSLALQTRGWRTRAFETAEQWASALASGVPHVLMTRAQLTPLAADALDRLSLQDARVSSVQLAALGGHDQRLPAELAGADLFIQETKGLQVADRLRDWMQTLDRSPFRVLLIDDDAEARLFAGAVLKRVGMQVEDFADADAAIEHAREWHPDLVLLDLYMPGLDGLAVTRRLRAEAAAHLQVVVLSGEERPQARYNALRLGVDDFLTKPVRPRLLIAAVSSRIKRARRFMQRPIDDACSADARLRRGDFLQRLRQRQNAATPGWRALAALRMDGATELRERLGFSATHALERAAAARLQAVLAAGDCYSLWEELGFGLLIERSEPESVLNTIEQVRLALRAEPFVINGESLSLSVSIGFALPPLQAADIEGERWIASAFAAVSVAAQLGGDRAEGVLSRDPDALPPERVLVIRHALADLARGGSLRFEFQPLLRLRGERSAYALGAKLRDLRAPLQGYPRREYLRIAREQKHLAMLERMCVFHALETVAEQQEQGRTCALLVPMDLSSIDARQLAWMEAEARRRPDAVAELKLEFDAAEWMEAANADTLARLRAGGWSLACGLKSWDVDVLKALIGQPVQLLRLGHAQLSVAGPHALHEQIAAWHALGREWLIDGVSAVGAVSDLWALGIDYLQGEALAAASPRPDFEADSQSTA